MRYCRYHEYRGAPSGWLDEIPKHWGLVKLRWISKIFAGGTPDKNNESFWTDGDVPWLNSGAVNQRLITQPSAYITQEALRVSSAKWVPRSSLLIALAGQGKTKGTVAQLSISATCNQSMAAIVPRGFVSGRFLYWWLTSNYTNIRHLAGGDLRDGLNLEMLGDIASPAPPQAEQTLIARFLDYETARIDALIEEQQRLIDLLQEKRQAVISHAVTKGLDPDVPMKDSGVEWYGRVPTHWTVLQLRRIVGKIEQGSSPECESRPADSSEWGVLKAGCTNRGVFRESENKALLDESKVNLEYEVNPGNLLMSRASGSRELIGSVAYVLTCRRGLLLSDKTFRLNVSERAVDPQYLSLILNSNRVRPQIELAISGAEGLANNITQATIREIKVAVPPVTEQKVLVDYIEQRTKQIVTLLNEANSSIELLKEHRSALISAAVTGKIDVRGWKPQDTPVEHDLPQAAEAEAQYG